MPAVPGSSRFTLAVFGAGPIGLELGQALARVGVAVHLFGKDGHVGGVSDPAANVSPHSRGAVAYQRNETSRRRRIPDQTVANTLP